MEFHTKTITKIVPDNERIGREVRELRKQLGFSLRSVAKLLGFSAPYLSDLELGRRSWTPQKLDHVVRVMGDHKEYQWHGNGIKVTRPAQQQETP
jgi:predicted transcriptional regulator